MADTTFPIVRLVLNNTPVEFSGADILECSILQEQDPISATLPVGTATVLLFTTDPRFSIYSDGEFYNALSKNIPVEILVSVDDVMQAMGMFYLDSWEMETENTLRFDLIDALGVCANTEYPGSFWVDDTPIQTVVEDILKQTNIATALDIYLTSTTLRGWIPPSSVRDALQQVCFAAQARAKPDPQGRIGFSRINLPVQNPQFPYQAITNAEKTGDQTVMRLPQVTDIELISHDYYNLGETAQTVEEIYSAWLEPGNYIISYPKPYWKVWGEGAGAFPIYVATEDGRVIVTEDSVGVWGATARVAAESETFLYSSNYVSITVDTAGQITLWGYPWLSADRSHRHANSSDTGDTLRIDNAMLVNSGNAASVLAKVIEYYNLRYKKTIKLFPKNMTLGNLYGVESFRTHKLNGIAERLEIDLTGGYLTTATFVGVEDTP